jgi:hypothetical protein
MSKYDRCTCKVRLKELDMCAHEIKLRGGFDHSCFIQRHFFRERVRGSLVGWTAPENDFIEGLLGCDCEEIDSDNDPIDSTALVEHKATVYQSSVPIQSTNYGGGVRPLAKKQISNILSAVTGGYNTFSRDQQFQISSLVLQLQDLMTVDNSQCKTVPNEATGITLDVPNATARATQLKNRAKPMHEIQANMASKKLRRRSSHLVFHKMFVDTLIQFWSMATQAGTFTVVSVTKAIWLQTVLAVNV